MWWIRRHGRWRKRMAIPRRCRNLRQSPSQTPRSGTNRRDSRSYRRQERNGLSSSGTHGVVFDKDTRTGGRRTAVAFVEFKPLGWSGTTRLTKEQFLVAMEASLGGLFKNERYKAVDHRVSRNVVKEAACLKSESTVEDHGVPMRLARSLLSQPRITTASIQTRVRPCWLRSRTVSDIPEVRVLSRLKLNSSLFSTA